MDEITKTQTYVRSVFAPGLPATVKISLLISVLQLITWPLFEYLNLTVDATPFHDSLFAQEVLFCSSALFLLLTLPNMALVGWELLIARKTKQYFWLMYALFAAVVLLGVTSLFFFPAVVPHHSCGCMALGQ